MNFFKVKLFLFVCFSSILVACSTDDDVSNYMKIGSSKYELTQGGMKVKGSGTTEEPYRFELFLLSPDFTVTYKDGEFMGFSGAGNGVRMYFITSSTSGKLEPGDYITGYGNNEMNPYIEPVDLFVGYDTNVPGATSGYYTYNPATFYRAGGVLTVQKHSNTYELYFTGNSHDLEIEIYYKGILEE